MGFRWCLRASIPNLDQRHETGPDKYDRDWRAWLVIFEVSKGKNILKQECTDHRHGFSALRDYGCRRWR